MLTRLFLILTLIASPLTPAALAWSAAGSAGCAEPRCCRVVERVTCCGERVVETVCNRSGGECLCASAPDEHSPTPRAPAPRPGMEVTPIAPNAPPAVAITAAASLAPFSASAHEPRVASSHNRVQALLGIWRT